jgi:membrane-bound lytic murein transglycosylase MltF
MPLVSLTLWPLSLNIREGKKKTMQKQLTKALADVLNVDLRDLQGMTADQQLHELERRQAKVIASV